nr:hypothetical protein [Candidatus Dependentiae bacterium]
MNSLLLITPPFVNPNCPYPATYLLAGYLKNSFDNLNILQKDLSVELLNRIFSSKTLKKIFNLSKKNIINIHSDERLSKIKK